MKSHRIGEIAALAGVTVETLRYYERVKVLPPSPRTKGGERRYDAATLERVRFIRGAQALGFTLREIRDLLELARTASAADCARARSVLERHVEHVDSQIALLLEHRRQLDQLRVDCESALTAAPPAPCGAMIDVAALFDSPARGASSASRLVELTGRGERRPPSRRGTGASRRSRR